MKLLELFAGYGGASFALKQLGIDFEVVGYSEIDKYAIQCYEQNHEGINLGDITKINEKELQDFDLLTGGFPCQSFSIAGKRLGVEDKRGQLFWDIIRIAKYKQPKYILLENVKGLTIGKNKVVFEQMKQDLQDIGYKVYHKVLNTKYYGIPQNRERVYFVCIRKDLKQGFEFPKSIELKIFLKDILEDEVDEKYYLTEEQLSKVLSSTYDSRRALYQGNKKVCSTLAARDYKEPKIIQVNNPKHSNNRVYNLKGISPTLNTMGGGNRQPFIADTTQKTRDIGVAIKTAKMLEKIKKEPQQIDIYHLKSGEIRPLSTYIPQNSKVHRCIQSGQPKEILINKQRIRKLTPKECFRLMGFLHDEIKLEGLSNTQKYKLAGNGWTLSPVKEILKNLLK